MDSKIPDIKKINEILEVTIDSIRNSRDEIKEIVDHSAGECKRLEEELREIQISIEKVIEEVDKLEILEKKSRTNLSSVSKNFNIYKEEDIRKAYELANGLRVKLLLKREEEKRLIERRKEIEIRLKTAYDVLKKAENINKQIIVAAEYLMGNANNIMDTVDDLSKRHYLEIKIIEAQEDERHRVSRDIHDGPAQSMANILVKAELCEKLLDIDKDRTKLELNNLKGVVRGTLRDLRKIIYELRPMSLDDLGLVPTIERYISNFIEDTGMNVNFKVFGEIDSLEPVIDITIFRILQESLSNIRKHSKAKEVQIYMERTLSRFNLSIIDDGIGFDMNENRSNNTMTSSGFGLISIRERVELLKGNFQIKSSLGIGTTLSLFIPLVREE